MEEQIKWVMKTLPTHMNKHATNIKELDFNAIQERTTK